MTDPKSPAQALVGAVLNGRWKVVKLLGEGGMGAVYEADGMRGEGKRALKVLHPEFTQEEQILSRFLAEAQACQSLSHPNIAQVFEHATAEDGTPYLVMELLQGIPVADYMEEGKAIAPAHAVPILHGVLNALTAAHARGIVHRDLKPDNLFLVRDPRGAFVVKVLDFGIAKVMDAAGGMGSKTRTGMLLGTPGYMSPEQIKNAKGVDPRSDLWSLGILFYEMLTGAMPFEADNEFARITAVLTQSPRPIEQNHPELAAWSPFFQRALAKDLSARFASADEMDRMLMAVARGGSASVHPPPPQTAASPRALGSPPAGSPAAGPSSTVPAMALASTAPNWPSLPSQSSPPAAPVPQIASTSPSAPLIQLPSQHNAQRPAGSTMASGGPPGSVGPPTPHVSVVSARPLYQGAPWWVVGVVGFVCLGIGFVVGFLAGG